MKDINGKTIKVGQKIIWLKNSTDLKVYDNFTAEVKVKDGVLYTDSPFKNAWRPIEPRHQSTIEIKEDDLCQQD